MNAMGDGVAAPLVFCPPLTQEPPPRLLELFLLPVGAGGGEEAEEAVRSATVLLPSFSGGRAEGQGHAPCQCPECPVPQLSVSCPSQAPGLPVTPLLPPASASLLRSREGWRGLKSGCASCSRRLFTGQTEWGSPWAPLLQRHQSSGGLGWGSLFLALSPGCYLSLSRVGAGLGSTWPKEGAALSLGTRKLVSPVSALGSWRSSKPPLHLLCGSDGRICSSDISHEGRG